MRDYLVFQLYGPLASWGDIAVGETRPSAITPGKSALLGLIASALGLKRPDTAKTEQECAEWENRHAALTRGYGLAVRVRALGIPLSDYHTAQVPSSGTGRRRVMFPTRRDELTWVPRADLNTILSRREYRQDTFCVVALWARDNMPYALSELRDRLLEPCFKLFLGRKACPLALPLAPTVVEQAECVEDALACLSLETALTELWKDSQAADRIVNKFGKDDWLLWDADAETRCKPEQTITRRDEPLSRRRWQFAVREEHHAQLPKGG